MMRALYLVPLALFLFFAGLAAFMLNQPKQQDVPSQMIAQPLPEFSLQPAIAGMPGVRRADLVGGATAPAQHLGELVPALHCRGAAFGGIAKPGGRNHRDRGA